MEIQSQTSQLNLETSTGVGWNQTSAIYFQKTLLIKPGAGDTLRPSASWHALFGGFPPLAQGLNWLVTPRPKGLFFGLFIGKFLQMNDFPCQGDAMKVISGHVTAHRSWNKPSNVQDRGLQGG